MSDRRNVLEMFDEQKEYMQERVNSGIEKYRKGDAQIVLKDNCGGVISNAKIKVKQKSHEFKFGANLFMLDELETEEKISFIKNLLQMFSIWQHCLFTGRTLNRLRETDVFQKIVKEYTDDLQLICALNIARNII